METTQVFVQGEAEEQDATNESTQAACSVSLKWYEQVPVVNLIYDLLFDEAPTPSNLEKLLNVFGIVAALVLSIILDPAVRHINTRQREAFFVWQPRARFGHDDTGLELWDLLVCWNHPSQLSQLLVRPVHLRLA